MAPLGLADLSRQADEPQIYGGLSDVSGRLGRSVTIALIASPIGLVLISVARLLIISNYNPATASAIVSSGGYVDTLLGTTIPLIPIFMPYLALVLLFFNRVILGILAVVTALLISPAAMTKKSVLNLLARDWSKITHVSALIITALIALAIVIVILLVVEFFGLGINIFFKTVATITCIIAIPIVIKVYPLPISNKFYSELIRQPWLPAETITLISGQRFTGYVLSDDPSFVVILSDSTRTIHYYPAADVAALQLCQLGQVPSGRPLVTLTPAGTPAPPRMVSCQTLQTLPTGPPPASQSNSAIGHASGWLMQQDQPVVDRRSPYPNPRHSRARPRR